MPQKLRSWPCLLHRDSSHLTLVIEWFSFEMCGENKNNIVFSLFFPPCVWVLLWEFFTGQIWSFNGSSDTFIQRPFLRTPGLMSFWLSLFDFVVVVQVIQGIITWKIFVVILMSHAYFCYCCVDQQHNLLVWKTWQLTSQGRTDRLDHWFSYICWLDDLPKPGRQVLGSSDHWTLSSSWAP